MASQTTSQAVARLLERQPHQPWSGDGSQQKKLLVVNPDGDFLTDLSDTAWCFHAGHAAYWQQPYCQAKAPDLTNFFGVLFIVAKEQALNQYVLEQLSELDADTPVWLAGEKRGGIAALVKKLPAFFAPPVKLASGNHCQLFQTTITESRPAPALADFIHSVPINLTNQQFSVRSLPGVFSKGRLDPATELLLEILPPHLPDPILDFACGNGVIAATIERRQQAQLSLCDVNPMAIQAAQLNLAAADNQFFCSDGIPPSLPPQACIISNPPFHTGLKTDYQVARRFIVDAHDKLIRGGQLYLVANNFLPWPEVIIATFGHCHTLASNNKFSVYQAQKS
ncbi:methyltransferase [Idiomarina seosinensis]|uniref:methyltransferase n=1 Tax=Idiomarina seosinensis TaxID=281739 RepID=UPI00384C6610